MGSHSPGVSRCGILPGLFGVIEMNERIGELYTQALEYADSRVPPERRYNDIYYAIVSGKHAELIVRECASKAWFAEQYGIGDGAPVSKQIKEHFGVE
jgi:hypothetical protein